MRIAFFALTLLLLPSTLLARTWTSGEYRIEAELVEIQQGSVVLKNKSGGGLVQVEIAKLSKADQEYLQAKQERLTQVQSMIDRVKATLAANDVRQAKEQLTLAKQAAGEDQGLLAQITHVEQAVHDYARFLSAYQDALGSLEAGAPLNRLGYNHEVLLITKDQLVVRGRRGKYLFKLDQRNSLPTWLPILIAQQNTDAGDLTKAIDAYTMLHSSKNNRRRWDMARIKPERFDSLLAQSQTTTKTTTITQEPGGQPQEPTQAVEIAAVPDLEKLRDTVGQVRELYKDQYEAAKASLPEKVTLIKTLIDESDKLAKDDPTAFFVMRFEAAMNAAELGDIGKAMESIDPLNAMFEAEGMLPHKANLIKRAVAAIKRTRSDPQARTTIDAAVSLKDEALGFEQFESAKELVESAKALARMLREKALIAQVNNMKTSVDRREALHKDAEAAKQKLAETPDDADANFKLGLYVSFVRGNWKEGLPQLAKGNITTIADAATKDLANPEKAADKKKIGDQWWDLAESPKYKDFKDAIQDRAAFWYRSAVGELSSLAKTSVEKRLKEVENRAGPASAGDNNVFLTQLRPLGVLGLELDPGDPPMHRTVKINGKKYPNSVWAQPEDYEGRAKITYALGKRFDTLRGGVGFDPGYFSNLPTSSPVIFRIVGDGKVLWITPRLAPNATASFKIDVSRINVIEFTTACFGSSYYARAAWATPILTKKPERKK